MITEKPISMYDVCSQYNCMIHILYDIHVQSVMHECCSIVNHYDYCSIFFFFGGGGVQENGAPILFL